MRLQKTLWSFGVFAQDIVKYDGSGLQTKVWDTSELDFVCDFYDIPEDQLFEACSFTSVPPNPYMFLDL